MLGDRFLIRRPAVHEQVHPESDLHSAGAPIEGANVSTNNSFLFTETSVSTVTLFMCSFSLNHGNSDPSVKTAPGINSTANEEFLTDYELIITSR